MADLNNLCIIGRLTSKPEMKENASLPICVATIANNDTKDNAHFINVKSFGNTAEILYKYDTGDRLAIVGRLVQDRWEDSEGNKKSRLSVIGNVVNLISKKFVENNQ